MKNIPKKIVSLILALVVLVSITEFACASFCLEGKFNSLTISPSPPLIPGETYIVNIEYDTAKTQRSELNCKEEITNVKMYYDDDFTTILNDWRVIGSCGDCKNPPCSCQAEFTVPLKSSGGQTSFKIQGNNDASDYEEPVRESYLVDCCMIITGPVTVVNPKCGDGIINGDEECDGGTADQQCQKKLGASAECIQPGDIYECKCKVCGNNRKEGSEKCDGSDLSLCNQNQVCDEKCDCINAPADCDINNKPSYEPNCEWLYCDTTSSQPKWETKNIPGVGCSSDADCGKGEYCDTSRCSCFPIVREPGDAIKCNVNRFCEFVRLLQAIAAGLATLLLVFAGVKWIFSGIEEPETREEAKSMVKNVLIGLVIVVTALELVNYVFGQPLGAISCSPSVCCIPAVLFLEPRQKNEQSS